MPDKLAYSREEAAAATGVSIDVIARAIKGGDLAVIHPPLTDPKTGKSRPIAKPLILADELARWLSTAA